MTEAKMDAAKLIPGYTNVIKTLLTGADWNKKLTVKNNWESADRLSRLLVDAEDGMGYCIDERKILGQKKDLKPGFVGGATGWMVLFMSTGKSFAEAVRLTGQLYQERHWRQMEGHIDNHHGHITDPHELAKRTEGCGFLGVWQNVFQVMKQSLQEELHGQMDFADNIEPKTSTDFINAVRENGGNIVPLTGHHKAGEAAVAINLVPGKTLDRTALFDTDPAFLWDAWKSTDTQTLDTFNSLAKTNLTGEGFFKLQASLHLATGFFLDALKGDSTPNLVIINPPPKQ